MTLPEAIRKTVEPVLSGLEGRPTRVDDFSPVGGGCISPGGKITTDARTRYFLKWASPQPAPRGFFEQEARSLRALRDSGTVRVPEVRAVTADWLLLEWLESGRPTDRTWVGLGERLAALHRVRGPSWGWDSDNYIGSLPQSNATSDSWVRFWVDRRLRPQWEEAVRDGSFGAQDRHRFDRLVGILDELLASAAEDGPSLLHGDLWGGNVHVTWDGEAALIDPSSYYGHREVDLAMAELFGGFDRTFFEAYAATWPLQPGYSGVRRELYQLYYLLVHVNLFGGSYVEGVRRVLRRFAE